MTLSAPGPDPDAALTEDTLLGGRVRLKQPVSGARVAIDSVFLAAAVPAEPLQLVLDVGCGSGAAALCLAARGAQCRVIGFELQRDLVRLTSENAALNGMSGRVSAIVGDLLQPPPRLSPGMFDHVMVNPPFIEEGRGTPAANPAKALAMIEGAANLADWVRFALAMVRGKGTVTFIHRADRIDGLLAHLTGRAGEITIFPLWPAAGRAASRILVRARKQVATPARLLPGLILHEPDGRFSPAAEAVLRGGAALEL
ncbi:MAG: methyltransferase [Stellaceae bacterium]